MQHFRQGNAAIGILPVLQHCNQCASDGKARAVEGVQPFGFALGVFEACLQATGLEGFAVADGADFAPSVF